jgi:hypothetical protein
MEPTTIIEVIEVLDSSDDDSPTSKRSKLNIYKDQVNKAAEELELDMTKDCEVVPDDHPMVGLAVKSNEKANAFATMMNSSKKISHHGATAVVPHVQKKFRPPAIRLESCFVGSGCDDNGERARELMKRDGVVVFKNIASHDEINEGIDKFWTWLENTNVGKKSNLRRNYHATHKSAIWKELGYSN